MGYVNKESAVVLKLIELMPTIKSGSIRIIVQDSRVVQIEKSEEILLKK
ncbi:DUF2292 domain-containing protein [Kurthia sibirica]|uniref:DUF2292 domain-containing protein n=1 Tax=Kurthia sibirica TaxID=202750 RepID=A0A2U3ALP3_9BACL|nr:DUF2292 domain-containing protein [Kurthia sibirica]PWI25455.1 DUF2292 domain-containing protein [Kurthia sibirica]GEK34964.1 hypothetical protein KSI01_24970 [Kurthia sibirica]